MIVPKNPVIADNGISAAVNTRERISAIIINVAPKIIQSGIVFFVFLPTVKRTICGTTNPTQLIVPENATELAVSNVAIPIINARYTR